MSLLGEYSLKCGDETLKIKTTMLSLYRAQEELGASGILDITARLDKLDLNVLFALLKHSGLSDEQVNTLFEGKVDVLGLVTYFAEQIGFLFDNDDKGKKKKPAKKK